MSHSPLPYEQRALQHYAEVCVNKGLVRKVGLATNIPAFVGEWIIARNIPDGILNDAARQRVRSFLDRHLPSKDQKEHLKYRLREGETLTLLDQYSVTVDLRKNEYRLSIPCLDEHRAGVARHVVDAYPLLLGSGIWGVGKIEYAPPSDLRTEGSLWLEDFKPMQTSILDIDLFCEGRQAFELHEWRDLLVASMGYNPSAYSPDEQLHLLTRLIPLVQNNVNLVELAPKGTGKSFVYLNLSRHVRLISGGKVTAAALFYNNATNQPGLLSGFDVVVFDEAQTLSFDNPNEIIGVLKDYLESGSFARGGKQKINASSGIVMLANIELDANRRPRDENLFSNLPPFLRETAFIDRLQGILPGWELPRIEQHLIATGVGFKADFFGDVLHALRQRSGYEQLALAYDTISGTKDVRDRKAILGLATGYLKLLFPHRQVSAIEFREYCLAPAVRLRQRVRDQLATLDREYPRMTLGW